MSGQATLPVRSPGHLQPNRPQWIWAQILASAESPASCAGERTTALMGARGIDRGAVLAAGNGLPSGNPADHFRASALTAGGPTEGARTWSGRDTRLVLAG